MTAGEIFKWGVFSPGRIAHQFADAIAGITEAEIIAVASSSADRAAKFSQQFGIQNSYPSYEELLQQSEVDAIYIASVHSLHAEQIRICLEAGIPVLCEKPITVNSEQLRDLITLASENNVFLMEALWTRFLPITAEVKHWLSNGTIGDLKNIESSFGFVANADAKNRLRNPALAGGTLLDIGIYPIAMSQYFADAAVAEIDVSAKLGDTGVDEQLSAKLSYSNGVISEFQCSINHRYENTMTLYGEHGYIIITAPFWGTTAAKLSVDDEVHSVNKAHLVNGFEFQIMEVMTAVRNNQIESSMMPLADSLVNLALMDRIRGEIGVRYPFEME